MRRLQTRQIAMVKAALFVLLGLPAAAALLSVLRGEVAEPVDFLTHASGEAALRLLLLTLLITPLARLSGWKWLVGLRRLVGLYAFFYALLHFCVYLLLDIQLDFSLVAEDILERRYITVGFFALLLLLPLAATSNALALKKLGARCWMRLHKLVYVIVPLAIVHFWWQIKNQAFAEPLLYAAIAFLLLALRVPALARILERR